MPGLFDQVKDSVLGIFGGTGVNPQASLRDAGAAAILSDTSDPLEAIASASMAGRQRQAVEQNKAQLQGLVQNAGMDLQSMQRVFLELLGQGNIDAARTVSEVLKTMAAGTAGSAGVNSQMVNTVASRAAGVPVHVLERFGEGAEIQVPRDPRTNQYAWDAAVPAPPKEQSEYNAYVGFDGPNASPTGHRRVRVVDGVPLYSEPVGDVPAKESEGGTMMERLNNRLGTVASRANELFEPYQQLTGSIPVGMANSRNAIVAYLGRAMSSDDAMVANTYAQGVLNPTVRWLSGAQMNMDEARRYNNMMFLQAGEKRNSKVGRAKARMRAMLIEAMGADSTSSYEYDTSVSEAQNKLRATDYVDSFMTDIQVSASEAEWDPYADPNADTPEAGQAASGDLIEAWRNRDGT